VSEFFKEGKNQLNRLPANGEGIVPRSAEEAIALGSKIIVRNPAFVVACKFWF
jgi:hypothetical protein